LQVGHGVKHGLSLAGAEADARDVTVMGQLPQVARRDAQRLRRVARSMGQGGKHIGRDHGCWLNGVLAAKCDSHSRWRSVRYRDVEQCRYRAEMPEKAGQRIKK